ncbi:MAG: antibiotic biosynthesis monooxygenase [Planctomycetes bacterium]|nr:antibiotic biosynthesis monooxygenase [Planctomycetota bacterium]
MVTFGLNYDIKPDRVKEFEDYSLKVIEAMQGMKGHVETRLYKDVAKPNSLMIYSNWESPEDFKAFMGSDAFKGAQNHSRDMLAGPPKHNMYTPMGGMGGRPH